MAMIVSQHILLDMIQVNSDEGKSLQIVDKVKIVLGKIFMVLYLSLKMAYSLISHILNFVNLTLKTLKSKVISYASLFLSMTSLTYL
jgi:hypothetical protein